MTRRRGLLVLDNGGEMSMEKVIETAKKLAYEQGFIDDMKLAKIVDSIYSPKSEGWLVTIEDVW